MGNIRRVHFGRADPIIGVGGAPIVSITTFSSIITKSSTESIASLVSDDMGELSREDKPQVWDTLFDETNGVKYNSNDDSLSFKNKKFVFSEGVSNLVDYATKVWVQGLGYTANTGTISSIKFNGQIYNTVVDGAIDLGSTHSHDNIVLLSEFGNVAGTIDKTLYYGKNRLVFGSELSNYKTSSDLETWIEGKGYLVSDSLSGYATESYVDSAVSTIPKFDIEVVDSLPTSGISYSTVYLVKRAGGTGQELYTEYIRIKSKVDGQPDSWETLGTQTVDLTGYATQQYVTERGYQTESQVTSLISSATSGLLRTSDFTGKLGLVSTPDNWDFLTTLSEGSLTGGTVTGITMNGNTLTVTNGVIDLGTVITSLSGYATQNYVSGAISGLSLGSLSSEDAPSNWDSLKGMSSTLITLLSKFSDDGDLKYNGVVLSMATSSHSHANKSVIDSLFSTSSGGTTAPTGNLYLKVGDTYKEIAFVEDMDLTGYATEQYVTGLGYLTESGVNTLLSTKGYLTSASLSGYATESYVNAKISTIPKFDIKVVGSLPSSDISYTTVYLVRNTESSGSNLYTEYIRIKDTANGDSWETLGTQTVDLTGYKDDTELETWISGKGYLTSDDLTAYTIKSTNDLETWISGKAYLTSSSLIGYAQTSDITSAIAALSLGTLSQETKPSGWDQMKLFGATSGNPSYNGNRLALYSELPNVASAISALNLNGMSQESVPSNWTAMKKFSENNGVPTFNGTKLLTENDNVSSSPAIHTYTVDMSGTGEYMSVSSVGTDTISDKTNCKYDVLMVIGTKVVPNPMANIADSSDYNPIYVPASALIVVDNGVLKMKRPLSWLNVFGTGDYTISIRAMPVSSDQS